MKHPLFDLSPRRLLLLVIFAIFLAEGGEMLILHNVSPPSRFVHLFLDMASMLVVLMPVYLFVYRPFRTHWHERQRMEEELRKSEERLNYALEAINDGVWDWIVPTSEVYFSPRWQTMLGYEPGEVAPHLRTWESRLHPEDKEKTIKALRDHVEGLSPYYESEHRLRTKSGHYIWILDRGRVVERDANGKAIRVTGTHTDITRRKQAQAEIKLLLQQLDRASEHERERLARDLHDQVGQMVTVLQLELGVFKHVLKEADHVACCQGLVELTTQLSHEIRSVTARLRPPALDTGLVPALEYDLDRLRPHLHQLRVSLHAEGLERERLDPESEITLFRIYQEAFNNAVKHARAGAIDIELRRRESKIVLTVRDDGIGFELRQGAVDRKLRGIGLVGMRERVAALGGHLSISSAPGQGTAVTAALPCGAPRAGRAT
jgi:two-component system sensor histidine kinase UhpB